MRLTGEEIQALLGATLIMGYVPFVETSKPILSNAEDEVLRVIDETLMRVKKTLKPPEPRTPVTFREMLQDVGEVEFSPEALTILDGVVCACLAELRSDADLSPHAGAGVRLEALRTAAAKIRRAIG